MKRFAAFAFLLLALAARGDDKLTIVKAGPIGEIADLAEANEIRVVFSEPMVVLGKIPKDVTPSWFHISPAVQGAFRWSGTTTLIFTPDAKKPLPFATKFDVTIDATAKSVAGHTLDQPYTFSFITPTIRLKAVDWYRKGGVGGSIVIGLRFNQPVDADTIVPHLQLRTEAHQFEAPTIPEAGEARLQKLEPQAVPAFQAKVAKAQQVASTGGVTILSFVATDWDRERFKPGKDLIVIETKPGVPPDTHIQIYLDSELAKGATVRTGSAQQFLVELGPTFFVGKLECVEHCDPETRNWIDLRTQAGVHFDDLRKAVSVVDVTDPAHEKPVKPGQVAGREGEDTLSSFSLDDLGYSILPARTLAVRIDPALETADGQKLGYTWMAVIEYWHKSAFTSFGDGHGVWESSGGPLLPFHARNYRSVKQWLAPLSLDQVMPTSLLFEEKGYTLSPDTKPVDRKLTPVTDKIQSFGINLKPAIGEDNQGLAWVAIEEGEPIANSGRYTEQAVRSSLVQATNLGISVKDSPQNTLIMVTRLDNAQPVEGAKVSIRTRDNAVFWTGTTDAKGIAIAPNTDLRRTKKTADAEDESDYNWEDLSRIRFLVSAEKDGDVAYLLSDWNDGIQPWEFEVNFSLSEASPLLRGTVFTDRGVYKLGEEVHIKAVVRSDTPDGMKLLPAGTKLDVILRDSHDQEVDKRSVPLGEWSSAEWTVRIPEDSPLGNYYFTAEVAGQRLRISNNFLVAAYRRPEFRVDVTLGAPSSVAGTKLDGKIVGRYLFGAPMSSRPVRWKYTKSVLWDVPNAIRERFQEGQWTFLGWDESLPRGPVDVSSKEQKLNAAGELKLSLPTKLDEGWPYSYMLEGEVTDVSRQKIANRASFRVDPAPWYVGLASPPFFADTDKGFDTQVIAASLAGAAVAGVEVKLELSEVQWVSAREAEGGEFYEWDSQRKLVPAGSWSVTTQTQPVPFHVPLKKGGEYVLTATAKDAAGHVTRTMVDFYAVGGGYTSWQRYDHNRIDLVPEKKTYKPGETARILIKSPWEHATALLTTEREGVRTSKPFELTSTQQTVSVPITEKDIPNVYVSVLLVKGRTKEAADKDESDPGKPTFRLGYVELNVIDAMKRLKVDVKADRAEFRPASKAKIEVTVQDVQAKPARAEVTLWAVDYGVLSLTGYETPDVLESIYLRKALQVVNEDSREKVVSRRVLTPKGAEEGGGGGADAGPGMLRKDFRVLAFWLGSVATDKNGRARTEVTLPESLTTYRIMAVAADKSSRFGFGQNEIRINKPVLLTPTFPRFLAAGDTAYFGAVVHSQLKAKGTATVTIKSLDPDVLEITGETTGKADVPAGGSAEVRFNAKAKSVGTARVQMTVAMSGESDGFEDVIPVRVLASPETVAAYGDTKSTAKEVLEVPAGVIPGFGGLHVETASTAMVGLSEGATYLVQYPYGCAEQRSSGALALMLTSDLGEVFHIEGIDAKNGRRIAQSTLNDLRKFQCPSGGFAFWPGDCTMESPYLTAWVLHVMHQGKQLGYTVDQNVLNNAYGYMESELAKPRPANEGWWPAYTSWQAFAIRTLVEGGRNEDSHINRLMTYVDRMPIFGLSWLADALIMKGEKGPRLDDLHRRISNAILPEGGSAHVEELKDPYLLYLWSSNVRTTAITLGTLVRNGSDEAIVKRMVRWLMQVRKDGRWGSTQENAWAMESLISYYRKYESETPDFTAVVALGNETIARDAFRGRSTQAQKHDFSMRDVLAKGKEGEQLPVTFTRDGAAGTLFYLMRLRYAATGVMKDPLDQGISVDRSYMVQNAKAPATSFKAGDLIKVTIRVRNTKERRFVAVTDPIPAGTEPVESWFATTASDIAAANEKQTGEYDWAWWERNGFDFVERHDDRVNLFATRLSEGNHEFTYLLRATTAGTFLTAPLHAEEMYEPEVFGRTATSIIEVKP